MATASKFHFVANHLALDFANTEVLEQGAKIDLLSSFDDLLDWCVESGALKTEDLSVARKRFLTQAPSLLRQAKRLRKAVQSSIHARIRGEPIPASAVRQLNALLRTSATYEQLRRTEHGLELVPLTPLTRPESVLLPVAESLADLLANSDPTYIKKCESPDCMLHFYDTSKNHSRRWCSMAACGNRHKVQSFRSTHSRRTSIG